MSPPAPLSPTRLRRASTVGMVVLCAMVLSAGAVFFVWQRYQFVKLGFSVHQLRQEREALVERIEPLRVEVEYLSRLERIDALARQQLGMRPPAPAQVIVIEGYVPPASR
jgi:cell division protein FtsL